MTAMIDIFFVSHASLVRIVISVLMCWLCFMIVMIVIMLWLRMMLLIHTDPTFSLKLFIRYNITDSTHPNFALRGRGW